MITLIPVPGIGEVAPGDVLAEVIAEATRNGPDEVALRDGDVLVVTQKIVSKAEGRLVEVDPDDPLDVPEVSSRCRRAAAVLV